MIIGLSGKKGSGKNLVGEIIQKSFPKEIYGSFTGSHTWEHCAITLALADPIKQIAVDYFGLTKEEAWGSQEVKENTLTDWRWSEIPCIGPEPTAAREFLTIRELLQWIGTELFRQNMHEDFWIRATLNRIKKLTQYKHHIITDVRFPNEAKGIIDMGGIVIRIQRDQTDVDFHPSENALDQVDIGHFNPKIKGRIGFIEITNEIKYPGAELYDYIIFNNGTINELQYSIKRILQSEELI